MYVVRTFRVASASERSVNYLLALSSFVLPVLALPFVIHKHRHLYNTHTYTYSFWVDSFLDPNKK